MCYPHQEPPVDLVHVSAGAGDRMNTTLFNIDLGTHLKIVVVGLMGATLFTWVAIMAHWNVSGI